MEMMAHHDWPKAAAKLFEMCMDTDPDDDSKSKIRCWIDHPTAEATDGSPRRVPYINAQNEEGKTALQIADDNNRQTSAPVLLSEAIQTARVVLPNIFKDLMAELEEKGSEFPSWLKSPDLSWKQIYPKLETETMTKETGPDNPREEGTVSEDLKNEAAVLEALEELLGAELGKEAHDKLKDPTFFDELKQLADTPERTEKLVEKFWQLSGEEVMKLKGQNKAALEGFIRFLRGPSGDSDTDDPKLKAAELALKIVEHGAEKAAAVLENLKLKVEETDTKENVEEPEAEAKRLAEEVVAKHLAGATPTDAQNQQDPQKVIEELKQLGLSDEAAKALTDTAFITGLDESDRKATLLVEKLWELWDPKTPGKDGRPDGNLAVQVSDILATLKRDTLSINSNE